jgi:hypothetical protein
MNYQSCDDGFFFCFRVRGDRETAHDQIVSNRRNKRRLEIDGWVDFFLFNSISYGRVFMKLETHENEFVTIIVLCSPSSRVIFLFESSMMMLRVVRETKKKMKSR